MVDIYLAVPRLGRYPPLATDTEVISCFSIYSNTKIIQPERMTFDEFITLPSTVFALKVLGGE